MEQVSTGDMGRAQGSEGVVGRAQVNKGAVGEAHDTGGTIMSLRVKQGTVGEAHVAQGSAIARDCAGRLRVQWQLCTGYYVQTVRNRYRGG